MNASAPPPGATREERLAAKLRENLRRRKAQARAIDACSDSRRQTDESGANAGEGLSKERPSG